MQDSFFPNYEKMRKYFIILLPIILTIILSCKQRVAKKDPVFPEDEFADGDLAFRRGMGVMSRVVLAADEEGVYSHVGILKRIKNDWYVIHAVPDELEYEGDVDRVKIEPLVKFYSFGRASRGAIMRYCGDTSKVRNTAISALEIAKRFTLFDHNYNLEDTTEMYCTEMVNFVYAKNGIDLSEGRRTEVCLPALGGTYIMPGDLMKNSKLQMVYQFVKQK